MFHVKHCLFIFIYARNNPESVFAQNLDDCRNNLRNSQNVFLTIYSSKDFDLPVIQKGDVSCETSPFIFYLQNKKSNLYLHNFLTTVTITNFLYFQWFF